MEKRFYKITTIILLILTISSLNWQSCAQNPDIELLNKINSNSSKTVRTYSRFISDATIPMALGATASIGIASLIRHDNEMLRSAIYIGASQVVDVALTYSLKYSINRMRPYDAYPLLIQNAATENSPSMPSGHTSLAFATATSLTLQYPHWYVATPAYLWACSVGYSRMNLGVHYPSDVVAGAALGVASAYITKLANDYLWGKWDKRKSNTSKTTSNYPF